jgi:hypothetical protein
MMKLRQKQDAKAGCRHCARGFPSGTVENAREEKSFQLFGRFENPKRTVRSDGRHLWRHAKTGSRDQTPAAAARGRIDSSA